MSAIQTSELKDKNGKVIRFVDEEARKTAAENGQKVKQLTEEMAFKPEDYGLPVLTLNGDCTGMTKDNPVNLAYTFMGMSGNVDVKKQGSSSISTGQQIGGAFDTDVGGLFNFTLKFPEAFEAKEGWGAQKKYCFKANAIDHSHARNLMSCKLWGEIVKSRKSSGGYSGAVNFAGVSTSHAYFVSGDEITVKATVVQYGENLFTGVTYPAGTHTVSYECFNPYDAEDDGRYAKLMVGVLGERDVDYKSININTTDKHGEWFSRSYSVDFPVDGSMIGFTIYSFFSAEENKLPTKGISFRNIKVDGVPYPLEAEFIRLKELPNGGAVDGFPIIITLNDKFYALGTFNIPKDGWMLGNPKAILCADAHTLATQFKGLATLNGDFELEYVEDENNAAWVLPSINKAIQTVMDSNGSDLDEVGKYIDFQSAVDYFIHTVNEMATDATDKNYILFTDDYVKWAFSAYDRDTTYGLQWTGLGFNSANASLKYADYAKQHRVMELIYNYKRTELKARAFELRDGIASEAHVADMFTNFGASIPAEVLAQNCRRWPLLRSTSVSNTAQILNWYRLRRQFIDKELENLVDVPVIPSNLFTMGKDGTEWCNPSGKASTAGMPNLTQFPGAAYGEDTSGRSTIAYRNELHQNNGGAYTFGATFTARTQGLETKPRKLVQLFDADGNVLTSGCSAGEYLDFYKGYYLDGEETTFTLSEEVVSFKVGFLWGIEPCTPGEGILISNIYLLAK